MAHDHHHQPDDGNQVIRGAWFYDLRAALLGRRGRRLLGGIADALELAPGDRVLDVGCGPGRLAAVLADRVGAAGSVVGVDAAEEMVERARAKRGSDRISFQLALAQALPFADAEFDAASCTLVLHHVAAAERATAVAELYRVLAPGGRLVIAEFAPGQRPFWHRFTHGGHQHHNDGGTDSLAEARELAAAAGFTDLAQAPTPIRWCAQLVGRKPNPSAP